MVIKRKKERGAALIESAITIPIILLISVAIFEFGRAYQTWQVLTNAAREGARVSIIAGKTEDQVRAAVTTYMDVGGVPQTNASGQSVTIDVQRNVTLGDNNASQITVNYPFQFIVLGPVMRLVTPSSTMGNSLAMGAVAVMRNEN
jgi:Flp pilus assembly protein TadG